MRPATRLTWLRGLSQSALAALAVTLTHSGDQVFTPHTACARIFVLLSLRLPTTGLNCRAGRLHPGQTYVSLSHRAYMLVASMDVPQVKSWQRGKTGRAYRGEAETGDSVFMKVERVLTQCQGSGP